MEVSVGAAGANPRPPRESSKTLEESFQECTKAEQGAAANDGKPDRLFNGVSVLPLAHDLKKAVSEE